MSGSTPLSVTAAFQNLGNAAYDLAYATWNASFKAGKVRMIFAGIPLILITTGIAARIHHLMKAILINTFKTAKNGVSPLLSYSSKRCIQPQNPERRKSRIYTIPKIENKPSSTKSESSAEIIELNEVEDLLPEMVTHGGKERNEALLKLLDLIENKIIKPWMTENSKFLKKGKKIQDPFIQTMIEHPETLKSWMRSIVLWQLCVQWNRLEGWFVKEKAIEPPSAASLISEIKKEQIDPNLTKELKELIKKTNKENLEHIQTFQNIVTKSSLSKGNFCLSH